MLAEAEMEGMDVGIGNIAGPEKVPQPVPQQPAAVADPTQEEEDELAAMMAL